MASYEFLTDKQSNYGWGKTWSANGRYPMIAKRSFRTLEDAQAFIDDTSLSGTACKGLILSVFADPKASNNGIYYVEKIKTSDTDTPGILIKAGSGTGSITAENYTAAKALATADNIGQIIYVTTDETSTTEIVPGTEEKPEYVIYTAGPYIVSGAGTVAKLGTTSASGDIAGDVETLKGKVGDLEDAVKVLPELKVKDIKAGEASIVGEGGIVTLDTEFISGSESLNAITHKAIAAKIDLLEEQLSSIPKFDIAVVSELPTEGISDSTVYLLVSGEEEENIYTEYIYVNAAWEKLGEQKLDLSGYLTKTDAESTYVAKEEGKSLISESDLAQIGTNKTTIEELQSAIEDEGGINDQIAALEEGLNGSLTDVVVDESVSASYFEAVKSTDNAKVVKLKPILGNFGIAEGSEAKEGFATVSGVKDYVASELAWIEVEGE